MTVAEMIEALRSMPQDAHVALLDDDTSLYFFDAAIKVEHGFVVIDSPDAYVAHPWVYDLEPLAGTPPSAGQTPAA